MFEFVMTAERHAHRLYWRQQRQLRHRPPQLEHPHLYQAEGEVGVSLI
jgi:hypothetical protein